MKKILSLLCLMISLTSYAQKGVWVYPQGPDNRLTPGALCSQPTELRYPEQIAYCERDVSSSSKEFIFKEYRRVLGYTLSGRHEDYKVDHFIPLCAGGSNEEENLWPQHVTIYSRTDVLEELGCRKLSAGRIKQKELVALIKQVKRDLSLVPQVFKKLQAL